MSRSSHDDSFDRAESFEDLFSLHFAKIRGYLRRQGLSPERSSELAQETFFRAWRAFDGFREDASPSTWLFTIARRLLLNELRSRRAIKRNSPEVSIDSDTDPPLDIEGPEKDPERIALEKEQREILLNALARLPEQVRRSVLLRLGDLKYREIAEIQGISIEAVKSNLHRGWLRLREQLDMRLGFDSAAIDAETDLVDTMSQLEARIDELYDELHRLGSRPASAESDRLIRAKLEQLRELQHREAQVFREAFEASLEMPIDAGRNLLAHIRELKARFEDPATDDETSTQTLHPPT